MIFAVLLVLASALAAYVLAEMLPAPRGAVLLAFAPLTLLNVAYGEVVPLALAAICAAAFLIWRGRWFGAGLAVCVALIQPNVGLPAVLATFIFAPRSRVAVGLGVASLALVSVFAVGVDRNVEYLTQVLPGMANAEIVAADQYNLSHLLYAAGFTASVASLLGKVWFGFVAAFGVVIAGILAVRRRQPELLPLVPPACVLLFGIYLHDIQILLSLAAALVIAARVRGVAFQTIGVVAVALLVAVWTQRAGVAALTINAVGVASGVWAVRPVKNRIGISILTTLCNVGVRTIAPTRSTSLSRFEPRHAIVPCRRARSGIQRVGRVSTRDAGADCAGVSSKAPDLGRSSAARNRCGSPLLSDAGTARDGRCDGFYANPIRIA